MNGEDLRIARVLRHVSQWKLAARIGIPATRLSEIENGKRQPTPEMIKQILAAIEELAVGGDAMSS